MNDISLSRTISFCASLKCQVCFSQSIYVTKTSFCSLSGLNSTWKLVLSLWSPRIFPGCWNFWNIAILVCRQKHGKPYFYWLNCWEIHSELRLTFWLPLKVRVYCNPSQKCQKLASLYWCPALGTPLVEAAQCPACRRGPSCRVGERRQHLLDHWKRK